jgi:hypothetical protein
MPSFDMPSNRAASINDVLSVRLVTTTTPFSLNAFAEGWYYGQEMEVHKWDTTRVPWYAMYMALRGSGLIPLERFLHTYPDRAAHVDVDSALFEYRSHRYVRKTWTMQLDITLWIAAMIGGAWLLRSTMRARSRLCERLAACCTRDVPVIADAIVTQLERFPPCALLVAFLTDVVTALLPNQRRPSPSAPPPASPSLDNSNTDVIVSVTSSAHGDANANE